MGALASAERRLPTGDARHARTCARRHASTYMRAPTCDPGACEAVRTRASGRRRIMAVAERSLRTWTLRNLSRTWALEAGGASSATGQDESSPHRKLQRPRSGSPTRVRSPNRSGVRSVPMAHRGRQTTLARPHSSGLWRRRNPFCIWALGTGGASSATGQRDGTTSATRGGPERGEANAGRAPLAYGPGMRWANEPAVPCRHGSEAGGTARPGRSWRPPSSAC